MNTLAGPLIRLQESVADIFFMQHVKHKKRPISRGFWNYLKYLPKSIRARIVRSKFEVDYELPSSLVLKLAETEDEIKQALTLVHDSYVELGYMDAEESKLRFLKHHALPTTVILVAKWDDEVIGTLSILSDSALGLPSEVTWSLEEYRKEGLLLGEISTLCIKKDFRMRRGKLFLPLCKQMYLFCTKILKLDGIIASTTLEVEPFYTDILLFEPLKEKRGVGHSLVKNNPSVCCFLPLNNRTVQKYKEVYNHKRKNKNLYHFFVETNTPNIILPDPKKSIQSYLKHKNNSINSLLKNNSNLLKIFNLQDLRVIQNLDASQSLKTLSRSDKIHSKQRHDFREVAWAFLKDSQEPIKCQIINISSHGLQIKFNEQQPSLTSIDQPILITFQIENSWVSCSTIIKWIQDKRRIGCSVVEMSSSWKQLNDDIWTELVGSTEQTGHIKKIA